MRKVVCVDIDETLVYSRSRKPFKGCTTFKDPTDGYLCHTIARPGAEEFLEAVASQFELISVTQGVVPFQKRVLESLGLLKYFRPVSAFNPNYDSVEDVFPDKIYGWNTDRIGYTLPDLDDAKWVLVDNLWHRDRTLEDKQVWINEALHKAGRKKEWFDPDKNFVRVEEFYGGSVEPLTTYIKEVKQLLC